MLALWVLKKQNIPEQDSATGIKHMDILKKKTNKQRAIMRDRNEWELFNVNLSHSDPTSTRVYIPETWINIKV